LVLPMIVLPVCLAGVTHGQRTLQSSEVQQVLQAVTRQPRTTWIPAGTIEATCREYRAPRIMDLGLIQREISRQIAEYQSSSDKIEQTAQLQKMRLDAVPFNVRFNLANESSMESKMTVKYDGDRFYWEIDVTSRQDSVKPDASLAANFETEQFDLSMNARRIFAWDGDKYTTYTASGGWACVDAAGSLPRAVTGPLTAGVIPWGYGRFSYANLTSATIEATKELLDGIEQIQMTVTWPNGTSASLTLDSSMEYAVTACTFEESDGTVISNAYDGYRLVAGNWVPSTVLIERRDTPSDKLLSSDLWTFLSVDGSVPSSATFAVAYEPGTKIKYISPVTAEPATYVYSNSVNTDRLLADHLAYAVRQGKQPQNCATAAVDYVVSKLGKTVSGKALAALVGPDGRTNMYAMKQLIQGLGLYCRAVRTDLPTLQSLDGAQAILHIPGRNHFIVLDSVDDRHVWLIDLANPQFYYRKSADFFPVDWSEGVALLVSAKPVGGQFTNLADTALAAIGGTAAWTCTQLLQRADYEFCPPFCSGYLRVWWELYTCEDAPSGTCEEDVFIREQKMACIPKLGGGCTYSGQWIYYYIWACYHTN
jgi:hypothetical protein